MGPPGTVRGFTLLELIVVLVLLGLVYALAAPMLGNRSAGADVKSAGGQLAAGLRKARTVAVSEHREAVLTLDIDRKTFAVTGDSHDYALPTQVDFVLYTAQSELVHDRAGNIRFYPDGASTGGRITLAAGGIHEAVDVDWVTGRVTIE